MCDVLLWLFVQLDDDSLERHKDERRVRTLDDDAESLAGASVTTESSDVTSLAEDTESALSIQDSDSDDSDANDAEKESLDSNDNSEVIVKHEATSDVKTLSADVIKDDATDSACDKDAPVNVSNDGVNDGRDADDVSEDSEAADDDNSDTEFPDTSLALHHVKGGK